VSLKTLKMLTVAGMTIMMACTGRAPASAPGGSGAGQTDTQQLERFGERDTLACDPGQEHWRTGGTPQRGGTITVVATAALHMDLTAGAATFLTSIPQVYETLLQPRACYWEDTAVIPGLAKSWRVSPDGLTITLMLRDDVNWHNKPPVNGRPFTSADVAFTIDVQQKGGLLRSFWDGVTHQEPDAHTVILKLEEPQADFLAKLAYQTNVIVPKEVQEQQGDFKNTAIGTGPFMVKEFQPRQGAVLERNPDYYLKGADGKTLPYIDEVRSVSFNPPSSPAQAAAQRTGQADIEAIGTYNRIEADPLLQVANKFNHWSNVSGTANGIWFKQSVKPWDDLRIRKAIARAVDYIEIAEIGRRGDALLSDWAPVSMVGYTRSQDELRQVFKRNPDESRRLLAEAGFVPGQLKFNMKSGNGPKDLQDSQMIQQQLAEVGISMEIEVDPDVLPNVNLGRFEVAKGQMFASFLPSYWLGDLIRSGRSQNYMDLRDPKIDALADAQIRELNPEKRRQITREMLAHLDETMPYVPGLNPIYYRFTSCAVQNNRPAFFYYNLPGLAEAWLDRSRFDSGACQQTRSGG
jgi:peptide/nickel transport system substrate-binding protein